MDAKHHHSTSKDLFLYLLMIVTLYISTVSFITLIFQYINVAFPDALDYYYSGILDSIRWSSSALIVGFPVYLLVSWVINKENIKAPEKREVGVRKFLVYLTLLLAAITIIVDLILVIFSFYSGELTTTFLLKIATVLLVAGAIFGYYLWDLSKKTVQVKKNKLFASITSIIIAVSIVGGFFIVGSPATQRQVRFDEERVSDLQWIQSEVVEYWRNKNTLPENLQALENSITGFTPPKDPDSDVSYEYNILGDLSFELCATFFRESTDDGSRRPTYNRYYDGGVSQNWNHDAGRVCFERTIDPDLHKDRI